jgi:hypothetical protein
MATKMQYAVTTADTHDEAAFCKDDTDLAGFRP